MSINQGWQGTQISDEYKLEMQRTQNSAEDRLEMHRTQISDGHRLEMAETRISTKDTDQGQDIDLCLTFIERVNLKT